MRPVISALAGLLLAGCATDTRKPLEGEQLASLYSAVEEYYVAGAKFRTDYDPPDAPYDSATLTRNFVHVAQRSETQTVRKNIVVQGKSIPLSRWAVPVRLWTLGATNEDIRHLSKLSARLSELTGLPFTRTARAEDANVHILVADAREREDLLSMLGDLGRIQDAPMLQIWPKLAEYPCIARVYVNPDDNLVEWAIIFIKAELSGKFRRSCLTEEFVQSLGLFNDGPDIRPSIFNDDAEFIELTRHDEYLLQILYDPRLKPGMTSEQAEPIASEIAAELLADRES